jgi:hypothetical protein
LKRNVFFFLLIFPVLYIYPRESKFDLLEEYTQIKGFVSADRLGNIYSIERGVLYKTDSKGTMLQYSNMSYGPVTHVDTSDPLNLLVFFQDFGGVVFLDNNLVEKRVFNASDLYEGELPQSACKSAQGGFWAYYPHSFRFLRYSQRGLVEIRSVDIQKEFPLFTGSAFMIEHEDKLVVKGSGIWIFDLYTNLLYHIPEITVNRFQPYHHLLYYIEDKILVRYNTILHTKEKILLPDEGILSFFLSEDIIYLQTEVSLKKYRYRGTFN